MSSETGVSAVRYSAQAVAPGLVSVLTRGLSIAQSSFYSSVPGDETILWTVATLTQVMSPERAGTIQSRAGGLPASLKGKQLTLIESTLCSTCSP